MAAAAGKYVGKKLLKSQFEKYNKNAPGGQYDPLWAEVPTGKVDRRGKPKLKRVKKQIPDYLSENDALVLAKVRKRAYQLDMALFNIGGQRFGWSTIVGLVPAAGDALDALLAYSVYRTCKQVDGGLPDGTKAKMLAWIAFDTVVGLVPVAGDIADGLVRANCRNVRLLEEVLDKRYNPARKSGVRKDTPPATVYEDYSDEEAERNVTRPTNENRSEYRHPNEQETGIDRKAAGSRRRR